MYVEDDYSGRVNVNNVRYNILAILIRPVAHHFAQSMCSVSLVRKFKDDIPSSFLNNDTCVLLVTLTSAEYRHASGMKPSPPRRTQTKSPRTLNHRFIPVSETNLSPTRFLLHEN